MLEVLEEDIGNTWTENRFLEELSEKDSTDEERILGWGFGSL